MGPIRRIKDKYGGSDPRQVLNRAIRAEIPGAAHLLDASPLLQIEADNPRRDRHPALVAAIRRASHAANNVLDELRDAMREAYGGGGKSPPPEPSPKKETRPVTVASVTAGPQDAAISFPSTPRGATTAEVSLALVRASSAKRRDDNRDWTPPAALVEQMGKMPDEQLASIAGVSKDLIRKARDRLEIPRFESDVNKDAYLWTPEMDKLLGTAPDAELGAEWQRSGEAVRRRRESLGIEAQKIKTAWTPERKQVLRDEPDNVRAAELLGISINAVKVARSRLKE